MKQFRKLLEQGQSYQLQEQLSATWTKVSYLNSCQLPELQTARVLARQCVTNTETACKLSEQLKCSEVARVFQLHQAQLDQPQEQELQGHINQR